MGHGLGSTDMLVSATHLLLSASRCHAMKAARGRGSDPRIFTFPWGAYVARQCALPGGNWEMHKGP